MYLSKEFRYQFLAAIPVFFNECLEGFGYGWTSPTLRRIMDDPDDDWTLTTDQASWIGSIHEAGRIFGPLFTMPLLDRIGRKSVLAANSILFFVTFALIAFTKSVPVIHASRLIFGVACGMNDVTTSIYISENFKPTYRGLFGSVVTACFYGGYLFELCLVNFSTYTVVAYTNAAIAFLMLSDIYVSTETPQFLIAKGKYDRAWKNFSWLQGKETAATCVKEVHQVSQFEQLKQHVLEQNKEKGTLMACLSNPFYRKAITLVLLFCVLMTATGFFSVTAFVSIAFTEGVFTPNEFAIVFGALQFVSAALTPTFIERANRRTILIAALAISTIMHALTATLFFLQKEGIHVPAFSWLVFTTITVYAVAYSSGIMTIFYTTRGELMPQNIRAFGGSFVIMAHGLVSFLTAKVFLLVAEKFGMYCNFSFYSLMSLVGLLFVYFVLPETRGKSLMQIQAELQTKNGADSSKLDLHVIS